MKSISLIFPCYNEAEGIPQLVSQLEPVVQDLKKDYAVELVFVDDGSKDNTYQLLQQNFGQLPYAKIIKHEKNGNLGAALKTGFANATGDLIATFDSDCTFPPSLLPGMLQMMDETTDIVTVSPYHPKGTIESNQKFRIFLSRSVSWMYRTVLNSGIYSHGGLTRVYKRHVVENVTFNSTNFLSVTEIMAKAVLQGCKVKELPAALRKRQFGQSSLKLVPVIKSHAAFLSKLALHRLFGTKL